VGRPGLDPGTLGSGHEDLPGSTEIHLPWSESLDRPPRTAEEHLGLLPRLQVWLQNEPGRGTGVIFSTTSVGCQFEITI